MKINMKEDDMLMDIKDYKLNCHGSPTDERDIYYSDIACADNSNTTIPKSFEIKYQFPPKDQKNISSCVAHALSEYEEIVKSANELFSVGFIYSNRKDSDFQGSGMILREALSHLIKEGNVLNKDFPINEEYPSILKTLDTYGKEQLFTKALEHKSKGYLRLNIEDIKKYLITENKPIILSVKVYDNFYELQTNKGIISSTPTGNYRGGHCMLIVGFNGDMLKILNSWGNLGDNGYVYLDIKSPIIKELWALTDERVITPIKKIGWRVQVSANKLKNSAEDDCNKLAEYGIDTCPILVDGWWKVQCGFFCDSNNRDVMIKRLEYLGYKVYVEKIEI